MLPFTIIIIIIIIILFKIINLGAKKSVPPLERTLTFLNYIKYLQRSKFWNAWNGWNNDIIGILDVGVDSYDTLV